MLTTEAPIGIIASSSSEKCFSIEATLLAPLREGKSVMLVVDDSSLPKRKRIEKPLLFLAPQFEHNVLSTKLLVSFQTYGCEIVDISVGVKPVEFIRLGLNGRLAKVLANSLNRLFKKGEVNGAR